MPLSRLPFARLFLSRLSAAPSRPEEGMRGVAVGTKEGSSHHQRNPAITNPTTRPVQWAESPTRVRNKKLWRG